MSRSSTRLFKAALSALHYSRAGDLVSPYTSGTGVIFMLHQVGPGAPRDFEPNRMLKVTPDFLDGVIRHVKAEGFDIIAIDDVPERLARAPGGRPFAVFTLDDGYKDNSEFAYPIFKRHDAPFTIYVASDFADGRGDLWWFTLEEALRRLDQCLCNIDGVRRVFPLQTAAQKQIAFDALYWWLRSLDEDCARAVTHRLAREAGFDPFSLCSDLIMDWDHLRELSADPLVTIAAHTNGHYALAKLTAERAEAEMSSSIERVEKEIGRPCRHISFPYGCRSSAGPREFAIAERLGMQTAVTTQKGLIQTSHRRSMTALPRLSLNGDFQDERYLKVLLSGAPFAFWNAIQRLRPALQAQQV